MQLTVKAEFLAGTDIEQACKEACDFAYKNQCNIEFDFNGITMYVRPSRNYKMYVEKYYSAVKGRS